jgi:hypothetical protein
VRWAFLFLVVGCSFESGRLATTGDGSMTGSDSGSPDGASTMIDGSVSVVDASSPDAAPGCPAGYAPINGGPSTSTYKIYGWTNDSNNASQTWANAKTTCAGTRTHLAFPNNQAEETALRGAIPVNPSSNYFWIGLTDAQLEGTWLTVLDTAAPYLNWASMQPNGGMADNCVFGRSNGDDMFDWNCGSLYPFACECE